MKRLELRVPEISWHDSGLVCTHDQACAICMSRKAVYRCDIGVFLPCDRCTAEGWELRQSSPWVPRWLRRMIAPASLAAAEKERDEAMDAISEAEDALPQGRTVDSEHTLDECVRLVVQDAEEERAMRKETATRYRGQRDESRRERDEWSTEADRKIAEIEALENEKAHAATQAKLEEAKAWIAKHIDPALENEKAHAATQAKLEEAQRTIDALNKLLKDWSDSGAVFDAAFARAVRDVLASGRTGEAAAAWNTRPAPADDARLAEAERRLVGAAHVLFLANPCKFDWKLHDTTPFRDAANAYHAALLASLPAPADQGEGDTND